MSRVDGREQKVRGKEGKRDPETELEQIIIHAFIIISK